MTGQTSQSLWWQWVAATAAGAAACALAARPVSLAAGQATGQALGRVAAEAVTGALALGGVMLGMATAQWLVGRTWVANSGRVAVASVVAAVVGGAVMLGGWSAVAGLLGAGVGVAFGIVAGLVTLGGLQWRLLRGHLPWARGWAASSVLGLLLAGASLGLLGALGGEAELVFGATFGAVYGMMTGRVVVRAL